MITRFLPQNEAARRFLFAGVSVVLTLGLTQLVFPGQAGGGRGTPIAVLFQGLIAGTTTAVFAAAIVLMYRTMRFVNFAQGPIGALGLTLLTYTLIFTNVPFPVAVLLMLALTALLGAITGLFLLRFLNASRLFLTVVTIVGSGFLVGSGIPFLSRLPFWPSPDEISTAELQDLSSISDNLPFAGFKFQIGSFPINFGFNHLLALELAVIALVGLAVFLRYTRTGTAVRAMAENPERASLLGIGVGGLTVVVWTIAGILDGMATLSTAAASSGGRSANFTFSILLLPLAPAVIARFRSLPIAIFAAIELGILREAFFFGYGSDSALYSAFLLVFIAVGLLVQRKQLARSQAAASVSWSATDAPRPIPHELRSLAIIRRARLIITLFLGTAVVVFPFVAGEDRILLGSTIFVNAIAVLSLVVLTGWAGQVSLGQYGMVGIGSILGGALTAKMGIPFWFAVPLATALSAGIAVLVGLPALRIKGLFLMVVTFGFAVVVSEVIFNDKYFGWLIPDVVDRPSLFFIDFEDNRTMYFLSLVALVLAIVVITNLRRSRVGRLLIALRENEPNVQSFGLSPTRLKLLAFAIAGGMAGFAGAIFAHQQLGVSAESFTPDASVQVFIAAVIGGVSSPAGALLGSAYAQITQEFTQTNEIARAFFSGVGPLIILFSAPGGLVSLLNTARDSVLRIVAQRRQIVVPSLFADYDPDALANRLVPLGPPDAHSGLAALPRTSRFTLRSELYKGRGVRIIDRIAGIKENKEASTLSAAARSAEDSQR